MKKVVILIITLIVIIAFFVFRQKTSTSIDSLCQDQSLASSGKVLFMPYQSNVIYGSGIALAGCIRSGTLKSGMHAVINGKTTSIKGNIEANHNSYQEIAFGDNQANEISILLSDLDNTDKGFINIVIENKQAIEFKE